MLLKCLSIVLLSTLVAAEIPSYFKVCGRRDPNLEKCVLEAVEALRDKLRTGIPELGTPSIEPLYLEGFPLSETETLTAFARNVSFYGFSNFDAKSFHIDLEKRRFDIVVVFKKLILDADYDVKAKIIVPIAGRGPIHILIDDVQADVIMKYNLVKKNGVEHMFIPTMTMKLYVKDYTADFKPSEGPDSTLATAINTALEGGRQEILESIRPTLERVISIEVLKIANKICTHFTYDELFPDRE